MNKHIYFYFPVFSKNTNGIMTSMLNRAEFFSRELNVIPTILSIDYVRDLSSVIHSYKSKGLIGSHSKWLNMYADLMGASLDLEGVNNSKNILTNINGLHNRSSTKCSDNLFINRNGKVVIADNGNVVQINSTLMDNDFKPVMMKYDASGNLAVIQYFDAISKNLKTETYMHVEGYPVLIQHYQMDSKTQTTKLCCLELFNKNAELIGVFPTKRHLIEYWFNSILSRNDGENIVISDCTLTMYPLHNARTPSTKFYAFIHSGHKLDPLDQNASVTLNNYISWAINNIQNIDGFIVLTKRQLDEIIDDFKLQEFEHKFHLIPHIYLKTIPDLNWEARNPKLCISMGSLVHRKQPIQLIQIFKEVLSHHPDAKLHLYGEGHLKAEAQSLIDELGLNQSIQLMGFTNSVDEIYRSAGLLLSTSITEGFPMSIMEGMRNGLPCIAYDCMYGPRDMISDGESGYVINLRSHHQFADAVIKVLGDPEHHEILSRNSNLTKSLYDISSHKASWLKIIGGEI